MMGVETKLRNLVIDDDIDNIRATLGHIIPGWENTPDKQGAVHQLLANLEAAFQEGNTPYDYYDCIGTGSFKETYELPYPLHNWVMKFVSIANNTLEERNLLEAARFDELDYLFPATFYVPLGTTLKMGPIMDNIDPSDVEEWDPENDEYVINEESDCINACWVVFQRRSCPAKNIDEFLFDPRKGLETPEGFIPQDVTHDLAIEHREWVLRFLKNYGMDELLRFRGFVLEHNISDLRCANIGFVDNLPVVFDWLSD